MHYLTQLQRVKENVTRWYDSWGNNFQFLIQPLTTEDESGEVDIIINEKEVKGILKYLASTGYLRITEEESETVRIEILPKPKPIIKSKALELIAQYIGDLDTGYNLINFLIDCDVDKKFIAYPQTKWRMVNDIFQLFATSVNPRDQEILFKIIEEATHPLMHKGDEEKAKSYENYFNNLLKYDSLIIKNGKLAKISDESEPDAVENRVEDDYDEEDWFNYDGGISSSYENTDLELFILKKILLEHKQRDSAGFIAKEFSFENNSLEEICKTINKLIEDKILHLSANTFPERSEKENIDGIEDRHGFINWDLVKQLDDKPKIMDEEVGFVSFDTEVDDEVKLKGRLDIAIEEFMNDRVYSSFGRLTSIEDIEREGSKIDNMEPSDEKNERLAFYAKYILPTNKLHPYSIQRSKIFDEIIMDNTGVMIVNLNDFHDKRVDVLKTLLALEKENILRIKELGGVDMYSEKDGFIGKWSLQDRPFAKIQIMKIHSHKQGPLHIVIDNEIGIKGFEERVILQKPKNKRIQLRSFPPDLQWEEISIQFLNDQEVIIKARTETHQTTYEVMGFQDERKKLPNKQWQFLRLLSLKNGEISWESNRNLSLKQINSIKKQKQLLSEGLKACFQIDKSEPFYDYKTEKAYRIKLVLIPEPDLKDIDEQEIYSDNP